MRFTDMLLKDIKTVVYDVKSLAIILIMPIVLMSILGASLQGVFGEETESGVALAHIGIVKAYDVEAQFYKLEGKMDLSTMDSDTFEAMNPEKSFFELMDDEGLQEFVTYELVDEASGNLMLENEDIDALVILPEDFIFNSYMVLNGSRMVSEIDYLVNPNNGFVAGIVESIIEGYVEMNNNIYAIQRTAISEVGGKIPKGVPFSLEDMLSQMTDNIAAVEIEVRSIHREEAITSFQYYSAAIMCMFLLYSAGLGGRALLLERKEKTIPRLTVSGNGLVRIVFSNYLRVVMLVILQSIIMIGYSSLVLGVEWGSMQSILVAIIMSALAVAAIGMFIAIVTLISDNYKVANIFEFGLVYIMALLGGSFVPVETLPESISKLGFLSLNGQVLEIYINGMYQLPISSSFYAIGILTGFTVIFVGGSMLLIGRRGSELAC